MVAYRLRFSVFLAHFFFTFNVFTYSKRIGVLRTRKLFNIYNTWFVFSYFSNVFVLIVVQRYVYALLCSLRVYSSENVRALKSSFSVFVIFFCIHNFHACFSLRIRVCVCMLFFAFIPQFIYAMKAAKVPFSRIFALVQ